jgi:hypothetical protein
MAKDNKKATEEVKQESQPEQAQEQQAQPLTVQDLITLKSAIELGTQRGAWRANELTAVGSVYERLSLFVASLLPPKETPQKDASADKGE